MGFGYVESMLESHTHTQWCPQELHTRVPQESVPQVCPAAVSHKSVKPECPRGLFHRSVRHSICSVCSVPGPKPKHNCKLQLLRRRRTLCRFYDAAPHSRATLLRIGEGQEKENLAAIPCKTSSGSRWCTKWMDGCRILFENNFDDSREVCRTPGQHPCAVRLMQKHREKYSKGGLSKSV